MNLKIWATDDPVNHDDLNANFALLNLAIQGLTQLAQALQSQINSLSANSTAAVRFSDGSVPTFSDGSSLIFSS